MNPFRTNIIGMIPVAPDVSSFKVRFADDNST
jgi:hypothetical protein